MATPWERYLHELKFYASIPYVGHGLNLLIPTSESNGGRGFILLLQQILSRPTARAVSRRSRQNTHYVRSLVSSILLRKKINELFESQEAKQTTEFGVGVEDTYSICYQPCMSDEALQVK